MSIYPVPVFRGVLFPYSIFLMASIERKKDSAISSSVEPVAYFCRISLFRRLISLRYPDNSPQFLCWPLFTGTYIYSPCTKSCNYSIRSSGRIVAALIYFMWACSLKIIIRQQSQHDLATILLHANVTRGIRLCMEHALRDYGIFFRHEFTPLLYYRLYLAD